MKKIIISLLVLLLTTGCIPIASSSIEEITNTILSSKYALFNRVSGAYKYYLPREMKATITDEFNEILSSKYHDYYLYVDLVSYYNDVTVTYETDNTLYYSSLLYGEDETGLLNIEEVGVDEYIITMYYNYGRIEVKVNKSDINEAVTNSLVILSSIQYNDDIIENMMGDDILSSAEEQIDIFEEDKAESEYLDTLEEEEDIYTGNEEEYYDPDVIN